MAMVKPKLSIFISSIFVMILLIKTSESFITDYRCFEAVEPCLNFLIHSDNTFHQQPSSKCCDNIQGLYHSATFVEERVEICEHFKRIATAFSLKAEKAEDMRSKCYLSYDIPIYPDADCST